MRQWLVNLIVAYIRRAPPHSGRGILGKLAWRLKPEGFLIEPLPGVKIYVYLRNRGDIHYLSMNDFARHREPEVFASHLKAGMTVLDIGANLGVYALYFARQVGPTGRVYAFEPVPNLFARLKEHIALNSATNVIPVPLALSDHEGAAQIWTDNDIHGQSSLYLRGAKMAAVEVMVTTLDSFLHQEGIRRVDAIKLDVEGGGTGSHPRRRLYPAAG